MPTGYTSTLYDGKQSFEDYAWGVARGFGALITMRDEPLDAPIPETFGANTEHYDRSIKEAREDLKALDTMTVEEADRRAQGEHYESVQRFDREAAKRRAMRERYEAVLVKARAYEPPTKDHVRFKEMMVEQLEESIKHDCGMDYWPVAPLLTGEAWMAKERKRADDSLSYALEHREDELERARGRTAWVQALRDSLGGVRA